MMLVSLIKDRVTFYGFKRLLGRSVFFKLFIATTRFFLDVIWFVRPLITT
jgi:hypothetical protein